LLNVSSTTPSRIFRATALEYAALIMATVFTVIPFRLLEYAPFIVIQPPDQAQLFGTVFPVFSVVEALAFVTLLVVFVSRTDDIKVNGPWAAFALVTVASAAWIEVSGPSSTHGTYADALMLFAQATVYYGLWIATPERLRIKALAIALSIAALVALCWFLLGAGADAARLNAPGFEITSTGYLGGIVVLLGLRAFRRVPRALLVVIGLLTLLLAASRLAMIFTTIVAAEYLSRGMRARRLASYGLVGGIGALLVMIVLPNFYEQSILWKGSAAEQFDAIRAMQDVFVEGRIDQTLIAESTLLGRLGAWFSCGSLLSDTFPYPIGSDWALQELLNQRGYPSHCHSTILQLSVKFGVTAIIFFAAVYRSFLRLRATDDAFWPPLLLLMLGAIFDYFLFVPKLLGLVFIFAASDRTCSAVHAGRYKTPIAHQA
jgi:hypothetical protein